jgi:hypothetical protein
MRFSMVGCIGVYFRLGGFLVGVIFWVLITGVSFSGVWFSGVPPIYGAFCLYFTDLCSSCARIALLINFC